MKLFRTPMLVLSAIALIVPAIAGAEDPVFFNDPALEAAVKQALGIPTEVPIMPADMLNLTNLQAAGRGIANLTGLDYATNLRQLNIVGNPVSDIGALASLTNLEVATIGSNVTDISPLADLINLRELRLPGNLIADITPLSGLVNLRVLTLENCQIGNSISPLAGLVSLEFLALQGNQIQDIDALADIRSLWLLNLASNQISDIGPLSSLTSLECLYLSTNNISNVSALSSMASLRELRLDRNQISNIGVLTNLANLQVLYLLHNQINDLGPLAGLTGLTYLNISSNLISDLSPLAELTALEFLDGRWNQIVDISPLAGLVNLRTLSLNNNQITDIGALAGMTSLVSLGLAGTNSLNWEAYCTYIPLIEANNPGVSLSVRTNPYNCNCPPEPTPEGSGVVVVPTDNKTGTTPVTLTFEEVMVSGGTTLVTSTTGPTPRPGFQLGHPATYYNITTTASSTGLIDVCISYVGVSFPPPPEALRLMHYENGQWVDCTTVVDTQNQTVCGVVTSLSPFAIMVTPLTFQSLVATPNVLWPPSHKMIPITVTWTVTDNLDPNPTVVLKSIIMSEGDETNTYDPAFDTTIGDGHTTDDIQVNADGSIWLRAERSGAGAGRTYTLTYEATDSMGNTATATGIVTVPHETP